MWKHGSSARYDTNRVVYQICRFVCVFFFWLAHWLRSLWAFVCLQLFCTHSYTFYVIRPRTVCDFLLISIRINFFSPLASHVCISTNSAICLHWGYRIGNNNPLHSSQGKITLHKIHYVNIQSWSRFSTTHKICMSSSSGSNSTHTFTRWFNQEWWWFYNRFEYANEINGQHKLVSKCN